VLQLDVPFLTPSRLCPDHEQLFPNLVTEGLPTMQELASLVNTAPLAASNSILPK
jgi:hypothetical protein